MEMSTQITRVELEEKLLNISRPQPCSFVAVTEPKQVKKHRETGEPNPFTNLTKRSRVSAFIGFNYQNSVNNQRLREGTPTDQDDVVEFFEPAPRAWGHHVGESPMIEHNTNGRRYMQVKVQRSLGHEYRDGDQLIEPETVQPFLTKTGKSRRQQVENEVIVRDYGLDTIQQITVGGETYEIID